MVRHVDDPRNGHPVEPVPRPEDALDLDPALGDELGELGRGQVGGRELAQPRQHDPHATPSNWARNRMSLSISMRMSGIAYRSNAIRSIPMPKANPV